MRTLSHLLAVTAVVVLSSCASSESSSADGLDRTQRIRAAKEKPLSDDPDSPLHQMRAADGSASMIIGTF